MDVTVSLPSFPAAHHEARRKQVIEISSQIAAAQKELELKTALLDSLLNDFPKHMRALSNGRTKNGHVDLTHIKTGERVKLKTAKMPDRKNPPGLAQHALTYLEGHPSFKFNGTTLGTALGLSSKTGRELINYLFRKRKVLKRVSRGQYRLR